MTVCSVVVSSLFLSPFSLLLLKKKIIFTQRIQPQRIIFLSGFLSLKIILNQKQFSLQNKTFFFEVEVCINTNWIKFKRVFTMSLALNVLWVKKLSSLKFKMMMAWSPISEPHKHGCFTEEKWQSRLFTGGEKCHRKNLQHQLFFLGGGGLAKYQNILEN